MGKIAEFFKCLWLFLTESANLLLHGRPSDMDDLNEFIADRTEKNPNFPNMVETVQGIIVDGWRLQRCPNCQSRNLAVNKGFSYVWCCSCGMTGPCFDGHPYDAVTAWNDLLRKRR